MVHIRTGKRNRETKRFSTSRSRICLTHSIEKCTLRFQRRSDPRPSKASFTLIWSTQHKAAVPAFLCLQDIMACSWHCYMLRFLLALPFLNLGSSQQERKLCWELPLYFFALQLCLGNEGEGVICLLT